MRVVNIDDIEQAHKELQRPYRIELKGDTPIYSRAGVKRQDLDQYIPWLMTNIVRPQYPDVDPRFDSAMMTMMRHCFLVGVLSGRRTA